MRTRILSAIALLPLATACAEVTRTPPEEPAAEVATQAAEAPAVVAAATPAPRPPVAAPSPAPTPARAVPTAPPTVAASASPPAAPPAAEEDEEEVAEAPAAEPAPAGRLGTTVASLGPPTDPGLWLETALVEAPTQGRIEYNGQSVSVQLRPSGGEPGSGSQISVEAMRALGAPLTGLPEVTVFAG